MAYAVAIRAGEETTTGVLGAVDDSNISNKHDHVFARQHCRTPVGALSSARRMTRALLFLPPVHNSHFVRLGLSH